jgi:hypothetical protein
MRTRYAGQHVVIEPPVTTGFQLKGQAAMVSVGGGRHAGSALRIPFEHVTPTLTVPPIFAQVVEQDLGGVKSATVVILIELVGSGSRNDTSR